MIKEHSPVALKCPLLALELEAGAVGVVVCVHGSGEAYEVEFMDLEGRTIAVETLLAHDLVIATDPLC